MHTTWETCGSISSEASFSSSLKRFVCLVQVGLLALSSLRVFKPLVLYHISGTLPSLFGRFFTLNPQHATLNPQPFSCTVFGFFVSRRAFVSRCKAAIRRIAEGGTGGRRPRSGLQPGRYSIPPSGVAAQPCTGRSWSRVSPRRIRNVHAAVATHRLFCHTVPRET